MKGKPMRVYADTSVFGGVFDEEFATPSRAFFERVRRKRFELVVSPVVAGDITDAPAAVRRLTVDPGPDTVSVDEQSPRTRLRELRTD